MPIVAREEVSGFKPAPAGMHQAVCVDVVDMGLQDNPFQPGKQQHRVYIAWQLDERDPETKKPYLATKFYTLSLHEKATLRADLESWRGRPLSADERRGFDLERLIGVNCQLNILHNESNGRTFANVTAIVPPPKGGHTLKPDAYIRKAEREQHPPSDEHGPDEFVASDDDVPF